MWRAVDGLCWLSLACLLGLGLGCGKAPPKPRLPADLLAVAGASYEPLEGLAAGSREAQESQKKAVADLGVPLEVQSAKMGIVFRLVPAGSYTQGSPASEGARDKQEVQHRVTLSQAFYVAKYEVTQAEWERVMGTNPSFSKDAGARAPVELVSHKTCQEFLRKLCLLEGVPVGSYRLLTEAEWEYACRAGTSTALYTGDLTIKGRFHGPELDAIAWYGGNSKAPAGRRLGSDVSKRKEKQYEFDKAAVQEVGLKRGNAYGLHDMLGNVFEMCNDWYGAYPTGAVVDPAGPETGKDHVYRGGSWNSEIRECRAANRNRIEIGLGSNRLGLRVARRLP